MEKRRWIGLQDGARLAKERGDVWLHAELQNADEPGIYIDESLSRFKVVYGAVERDARGRPHARQRTKTFARDFESEEFGAPIEALADAVEFKRGRDHERMLGRERRVVTLDETFADYVTAHRLRPTTSDTYKQVWRQHVSPVLGALALQDVTIPVVERWYDHLDVPPASKAKAGNVVRSVLRDAYRHGTITTDPSRVLRISSPRSRVLREEDIPDGAQVEKLAAEVGDRYSALVKTIAYSGLRVGEALGLRWSNVNLDERRITVSENLTETSAGLRSGEAKTAHGTRPVRISATVAEVLRDHRERFPSSDYVFTLPSGKPVRPKNFRARVWGPARQRAGMPSLRIHDLRHVFASRLIAAGVPIEVVSKHLGHADVATTQRIYTHLIGSQEDRVADAIDAAFGNGVT